ncbi:MAG: hypothetical protein H8E37_04615 [Planctomycetes bacterium]|nr:hypothetical protein [Planctomycetota bacterium]
MDPAPNLSYFGIGSCVLWALGITILAVVFISNHNSPIKLAGIEIIVLGPIVVILHLSGIYLGSRGGKEPALNPLSRVGVLLNVLPFVVWFAAILIAALRRVFF